MKVGVIISPWGTSPDTSAKVGGLSVYAETLPNVVAVDSGFYGPTDKDIETFKEWIKKHGVDRVVFASCRPRLFKEAYKHAAIDVGINKYLIEVIDISEHNFHTQLGSPTRQAKADAAGCACNDSYLTSEIIHILRHLQLVSGQ